MNHHNIRPILQYDLMGTLIKRWESAKLCVNMTKDIEKFKYKALHIAAKSKKGIYKGYIWKYEIKQILENEVFKSLKFMGYENYDISNMGRVYNKRHNKFLITPFSNTYEYVFVNLVDNNKKNKRYILHNLIIRTFYTNLITNYSTFTCNYKDNNKLNTTLENLELVPEYSDRTYYNYTKYQKIYQYNKDKIQIKQWNNIDDILYENKDYIKYGIQRSCNKLTMYKDYYWEYEEIKLLENEKFVSIKDFDNYKISNHGRIINKYNKIIQGARSKGLVKYKLFNKIGRGVSFSMHKLVAEHFVMNPTQSIKIIHIDGNNMNNHYTNLKYV